MRLYSRTGAVALEDPEFGRFEADAQGGFNLPDELSDRLHGFAAAGRPLWETDIERQQRMIAEELERRKDPATLLSAVEQIVAAARATAPVSDPGAGADDAPVTKSTRPRKTATKRPASHAG